MLLNVATYGGLLPCHWQSHTPFLGDHY